MNYTNVYIGNVTIDEFEKRCGCIFSKTDKTWLKKHRADSASKYTNNQFHIFSKPFNIHCGTNIVDKLVTILEKYNDKKTFDEELSVVEIEQLRKL